MIVPDVYGYVHAFYDTITFGIISDNDDNAGNANGNKEITPTVRRSRSSASEFTMDDCGDLSLMNGDDLKERPIDASSIVHGAAMLKASTPSRSSKRKQRDVSSILDKTPVKSNCNNNNVTGITSNVRTGTLSGTTNSVGIRQRDDRYGLPLPLPSPMIDKEIKDPPDVLSVPPSSLPSTFHNKSSFRLQPKLKFISQNATSQSSPMINKHNQDKRSLGKINSDNKLHVEWSTECSVGQIRGIDRWKGTLLREEVSETLSCNKATSAGRDDAPSSTSMTPTSSTEGQASTTSLYRIQSPFQDFAHLRTIDPALARLAQTVSKTKTMSSASTSARSVVSQQSCSGASTTISTGSTAASSIRTGHRRIRSLQTRLRSISITSSCKEGTENSTLSLPSSHSTSTQPHYRGSLTQGSPLQRSTSVRALRRCRGLSWPNTTPGLDTSLAQSFCKSDSVVTDAASRFRQKEFSAEHTSILLISRVFVDPKHRGSNLGLYLIDEACRHLGGDQQNTSTRGRSQSKHRQVNRQRW
jgi:hypothetical protein